MFIKYTTKPFEIDVFLLASLESLRYINKNIIKLLVNKINLSNLTHLMHLPNHPPQQSSERPEETAGEWR